MIEIYFAGEMYTFLAKNSKDQYAFILHLSILIYLYYDNVSHFSSISTFWIDGISDDTPIPPAWYSYYNSDPPGYYNWHTGANTEPTGHSGIVISADHGYQWMSHGVQAQSASVCEYTSSTHSGIKYNLLLCK